MAHIISVRMKSFKSVGSEVTVPFARGLCAIVGPNGCGKSSLLEAVLFAFAAPLKSFGVTAFSELANSDSMEVCEVCVQLRARGGVAHSVAAALTPDGGRAFKVNARNKSGREVRDFLRSLGISLEGGAAVIRQARVTALADSAGPAELAALVAEASGLGRWNEEVAAVTEEVKRTRKALGEVQAGLGTLESSLAADEAQLAAVERLQALDHEAAELAQRMAGLLAAALDKCTKEAAAAVDAGEATAGAVVAAQERVARCQDQLAVARQALAAAQREQQQEGQQNGGSSTGEACSLLALQQRVAAAEEEVRLAQEEAGRLQQLEAELEAAAVEVARQEATRAAAAAELAACQQAQRRVASDLQLAHSAASGAALRASLAAEERRLQAAVAAKQRAVEAAGNTAEQTAGRLTELHGELQRLAAAQQGDGSRQGPDGASWQQEQARLRLQEQQQRARLQALRQQEQRLASEAGTLAARLGSACGGGSRGTHLPAAGGPPGGAPAAACRPLHQCFTFCEPQRCGQYAEALAVLAGRKLGVVVADSLEAAGQLLSRSGAGNASGSGTGSRIWPLDSLSVADHTEQQRRAAASFPEGQVVLPLELLGFHPSHRPAILRAFGSHVIAASDAVAEQLVSRFGVPCVTLGGRLTSRGTLQGGWRGDGGGAGVRQLGPLHLKLSLALTEQQLAAVQGEAGQAQAELGDVQRRLEEAVVQQEAAEAAAAELAAAEREMVACQRALAGQQAAKADAREALERLRAELAAKKQVLASMGPADQQAGRDGGSSSSGGGAQKALQQEQARLLAAQAELERAASEAAAQLAAAGGRQAKLEDELALLGEGSDVQEVGNGYSSDALPSSCRARLAAARSELAAASCALLAWQADMAMQSAAVAAREAEAEEAAGELGAAKQALTAATEEAAALAAAAERAAAQRQELQKQLDVLLREVPELEAVLLQTAGRGLGSGEAPGEPCMHNQHDGSGGGSTGSTGGSVGELRKAAAALGRQRGRLLEERRRSSDARLPVAELLRFREQKAVLAAARQQAGTLGTAAQRLQEGITASAGQVLAAHDAVFCTIAATFASLTAAVLPAYRLRLSKVGREVHEGLVLEFAPHQSAGKAAAAAGAEEEGENAAAQDAPADSEGEGAPHGKDISGSDGWRRGLDALSGGQRTMVSLALVIAAAMAGGGTSVLLMDEVDAALDEANQQLVARLFDSLSRSAVAAGSRSSSSSSAGASSAAGCSQVLAVSHSPTFQQLCRHVVRLTRGPQGTRLAGKPGQGGHGAGGKGGAAVVAEGHTKKARRK